MTRFYLQNPKEPKETIWFDHDGQSVEVTFRWGIEHQPKRKSIQDARDSWNFWVEHEGFVRA